MLWMVPSRSPSRFVSSLGDDSLSRTLWTMRHHFDSTYPPLHDSSHQEGGWCVCCDPQRQTLAEAAPSNMVRCQGEPSYSATECLKYRMHPVLCFLWILSLLPIQQRHPLVNFSPVGLRARLLNDADRLVQAVNLDLTMSAAQTWSATENVSNQRSSSPLV